MRRAHSVVVSDDHPIVRSGMRLLLGGSRFFECVGEAKTGAETIIRCEQFRPDVLLLDLRLPDLPAATICSRVIERQPDIAIIILTAYEEETMIRGCLKAGAQGCLFKDVSEQNLLSALMQAAHGRTVIDPRLAGAISARDARGRTDAGDLTEREQDVLLELARGLTTHEIASVLDLSPNTIKSHLRRVFRKMDAHNRVQALAAARERGLV